MSEAIHRCDPRHPERIAENQERYAAILQEQRPDSSQQLRSTFLESMKGKEYGEGPLLAAFDWYWNGWAASSGARTPTSEPYPDRDGAGLTFCGKCGAIK
jgi:hypothetical protein